MFHEILSGSMVVLASEALKQIDVQTYRNKNLELNFKQELALTQF